MLPIIEDLGAYDPATTSKNKSHAAAKLMYDFRLVMYLILFIVRCPTFAIIEKEKIIRIFPREYWHGILVQISK